METYRKTPKMFCLHSSVGTCACSTCKIWASTAIFTVERSRQSVYLSPHIKEGLAFFMTNTDPPSHSSFLPFLQGMRFFSSSSPSP